MRRLVLAAAALATLSVAAPALAQPLQAPQQQDCLRIGQVYDFKPVPGNRSLIVTDRLRHKYKVNFMGICRDMQFNLGLGFKSFGTGQLSCLARGDYVISRQATGPADRCPIQTIEPYTAEMERADAEAAKAKTPN